MKAIVEAPIAISATGLFISILNTITGSKNEKELRERMDFLKEMRSEFDLYFKFDFDESHMWLFDQTTRERVVLVEF